MSKHTYSPGPSKEYIRNSVFLHFIECTYVLTLPNLYFGLEKMLLDDGKQVDCTEYEVNTFEGQKQIAPPGITLYNLDVKDLNLSKYDGVFLDFMGTFNRHTPGIMKQLHSGTRIAMTFMMARENKTLQQEIDITNREESYVKLLSKHNVHIEKYANYCDTTPMCVFFGHKI